MKISDPIYGIIEVPYIFHPIIESKDFVRLRSIQQVHFSNLLSEKGFNRYNHSIGVFYLSKIFLDHIKEEIILNDSDILHFLLAALFHDICHLPYGYVLEGHYGISHEKLLDKYFETHFQNELSEVEDISGVDIDVKRITKIIQ
ncbi:MAG: hypothetical protein CVU81_02680 [Euryarchaeota archaeon HGW-Euryarchaeota-1]|nr:MAG: hypothetical protein CVU81_02680 [Euryarchaeota archaeon HGW-Euryarchaeota-1]